MRTSALTLWESTAPSLDTAASSRVPSADIPMLNSLALRSLAALFDEKEQLFCERVVLRRDGFHRDPTSRKHTIVAWLGLRRLATTGGTQPFDLAAIQRAVSQDRSWVRSAADLGLLAWFTAVCRPDQLGAVLHEFDFENALANYDDGREAQTAGLAWFLIGIAHARLACLTTPQDLTDVAVDAYHLLQNNQSQEGIFGHAGATRFPRRSSCSRFGTFSDQMFAILALSMFAQAFQIEEPLESALACGNAVCALQGELGQWWFLYDKRTCRVAGRYPVRSLHQYGTAPCALLTLGDATGRSYHEAILKGLSWIAGVNELRKDLRNVDQTIIWDSIGLKSGFAKWWESMLGFLLPSRKPATNRLGIRYEARPDHFGWLLYAFGSSGLPTAVPPAKIKSSAAAGFGEKGLGP